MSSDISYDPVSAIDENEAVGLTADIFLDIRQTMKIPLVTSIWRGLADIDDSLEAVWSMAKPIYQTEKVENKLKAIISKIDLPLPSPLENDELENCGLTSQDWEQILTILKAYNRSNGMNMVALHSMIKLNFPKITINTTSNEKINWPILPKLMQREQINDDTWDLICDVNSLCAPNGKKSHVATLWRHLAHWPSFLKIINKKLKSLNKTDTLQSLLLKTKTELNQNGLQLKSKEFFNHNLSPKAYSTIKDYVYRETQVVRMVIIGQTVQNWIESQKNLQI